MAALRSHFGLCEPPHDHLKAGNCAKGINDWIWDFAAIKRQLALRLVSPEADTTMPSGNEGGYLVSAS